MSHILENVLFLYNTFIAHYTTNLYCFHMVNQHRVLVSYSAEALSNKLIIVFHSLYANLFPFDK